MSIKHALFGKPIATKHAHHEKLAIAVGLAVFASDALSSVAYATEEILHVLTPSGDLRAYYALIPVVIALTILMLIVGFSYFQTIAAYPRGGGTYLVSTENLGHGAGQVAGASLLLDYVLTVAVSISSGTAAIVSIWPQTQPFAVWMGLGATALLCIANLRGAKESGLVFAIPTYSFVVGVILLIIATLTKLNQPWVQPKLPPSDPAHALGVFLLLRAFAASCTALTGTEAIADGVLAFKEPAAKNAQRTLALMVGLLVFMFGGISYAAMRFGITPMETGEPGYKTVLAQVTAANFGTGPMYGFILVSTALILFLAANTAFADFPRLCSFIAKDGYMPRQLMTLGDRLVFQNGVILLSLAAGGLIVAYNADTHSLIPLYAMGVFISFTLSQAGMAVKFFTEIKQREYRLARETQEGEQRDTAAVQNAKRKLFGKMAISGFGAVITLIVTGILLVTKWSEGAYLVVVVILAFLGLFWMIKRHYRHLARELTVTATDTTPNMRTTTLLLVPRVHKGILKAIKYAQLSSPDVRALHVTLDPDSAKKIKQDWMQFGSEIPLVILESPYRSLVEPVIDYLDTIMEKDKDMVVTVIVPVAVPRLWIQGLLHNNASIGLNRELKSRRNVVVTTIRYFLD